MALDWVDKIDEDGSGNGSEVHAEDVNALARAIRDNENSIGVILSTKADKADTLEGYGITDSYTKQQTDAALLEKSDATNFKNGSGTGSLKSASATSADGIDSFAAGTGTTALGNASHVQGKYNISDNNGTYAHIIGNGTANNARSNAHTVDWDGNGWFAGKVTVGESKDELITVDDALKKFCLNTTLSVQNSKSLTVTDGLLGTDLIDLKISGTQNGLGDFNSETGKYDIPISLRGKNLFDFSESSRGKINCKSGDTFSNGVWMVQGATGEAEFGSAGGTAQIVLNKALNTSGKRVTISGYVTRKTEYPIAPTHNRRLVVLFGTGTSNYAANSMPYYSTDYSEGFTIDNPTRFSYTFTPNYNVGIISFRLAGAKWEIDVDTIQVELSPKAKEGSRTYMTPFEPYVSPQSITLSLNSPIADGEYESISDKGETLTMFSHTNIIEVGTTETPAEIEASYYQDINTVIAQNYTELQAQIDAITVNS